VPGGWAAIGDRMGRLCRLAWRGHPSL